jgi:hypothetical protein
LLCDARIDPAAGPLPVQPVDHGLIAALPQPAKQTLHLPYAQWQFLGCRTLCDQLLLGLLQRH